MTGMTPRTIRKRLTRNGIEIRPGNATYSSETKDEAIKRYLIDGHGTTKIGKDLGTSANTVMVWLKKEGYTKLDRGRGYIAPPHIPEYQYKPIKKVGYLELHKVIKRLSTQVIKDHDFLQRCSLCNTKAPCPVFMSANQILAKVSI